MKKLADVLPFGKKPLPPTEAELQAESDAALRYYEAKGLKLKDRNVSHALFRQESDNTFRVICLDCTEQFDLFGRLMDARVDGSESTIVQQVMEHQGKCSDRRFPTNTTVYQNRLTPNFFGLAVTWKASDAKPSMVARP